MPLITNFSIFCVLYRDVPYCTLCIYKHITMLLLNIS